VVLPCRPPPGYAHSPTLPVGLPSTTDPDQANADDQESKRRRIEWTCDACDLSLDSEQALKSHRKSHVKCSMCSFEAAPKVVKGHFQSVHEKVSVSSFKTVTIDAKFKDSRSVLGAAPKTFKSGSPTERNDFQEYSNSDKKIRRQLPRQKQIPIPRLTTRKTTLNQDFQHCWRAMDRPQVLTTKT
jgi:hypothetical protein